MLRLTTKAFLVGTCSPLLLIATACSEAPAGSIDSEPGSPAFSGIGDEEVISLVGTEPFWSMVIDGNKLTYSTPDNIDGEVIEVSRFNGNNGLGVAGALAGHPLAIAITPGACSDGMSDRRFPYTATVTLKGETLFGCGHTDKQPYQAEQ